MIRQTRVDPAGPEAWERVRAIRLRALSDAPDAFEATLEQERDQPPSFWRERLERPDATTLLATAAEDNGGSRDVGLAVVAPSFDRPEAAGLYAVWVAPEARGLGVGDMLIEAAIACARAAGYRRLVLDVGDHNLAAIRLYERHGFAPTGRTFALPPPREHLTEHERAVELQAPAP